MTKLTFACRFIESYAKMSYIVNESNFELLRRFIYLCTHPESKCRKSDGQLKLSVKFLWTCRLLVQHHAALYLLYYYMLLLHHNDVAICCLCLITYIKPSYVYVVMCNILQILCSRNKHTNTSLYQSPSRRI